MRGEYARAFEILKPLAEKGDAKAAYVVGRQYQLGQGVGRDLGESWYWYRRAEAKGHVEAGLFRHLLVSKWKISDADRARGEAKFASLGQTTRRLASRIRLRPSPRPTAAVALPRSLPDSVTVSKLPLVEARPSPQRVAKTTPVETPKTPAPARQPDIAARVETCAWCRNEEDTEPELESSTPQQTNDAPVRGQYRTEEPTNAYNTPPSWQEEQYYAEEPPAALYPAQRNWTAYRRPHWRGQGWRTRMRWRRIPPGYTRGGRRY